ncbi:hypothetical protein ACFVYF_32495 [Streptomyces sp. NPDC058274]|uniref:hypothetical protein n=1 Tax=Streptomyces sp. NPDC058274 TaxID=3346416 RepID=UPI0036EE41E6
MLIAGQVYAMGDAAAAADGPGKRAGLVSLAGEAGTVAPVIGGSTVLGLRARGGVVFAPAAPARPVPGGSAPRPPYRADALVLKRRTG